MPWQSDHRAEQWGGAAGAVLAAVACLLAVLVPGRLAAAPTQLAPGELDPAPLERLFSRHVRDGAVDYRELMQDEAARGGLKRYLDAAASMPESAPLATWLNVYNAQVIEAVLAHYPLDSVKSVPDFFQKSRREIAGQRRSLDDLEHGVIRPRFHDARVHMALNCAAVSCPKLASRPFRQATLDATLDARSRAAMQNPKVVRLEGDVLHHSQLFEWFREDFVRDAGSVRAWIARHAGRPIAEDVKLKAMAYDWSLAEAK